MCTHCKTIIVNVHVVDRNKGRGERVGEEERCVYNNNSKCTV